MWSPWTAAARRRPSSRPPVTGLDAGGVGSPWPCALGLLPLVLLASTPQKVAGLARPQCGAQSAAEARGKVGAGANETYHIEWLVEPTEPLGK